MLSRVESRFPDSFRALKDRLKIMDLDLSHVFHILDENSEGRIRIARFIDIAQNYYSDAEQLASITKALDPTNSGLINYDQFCDGIGQISSLQGLTWKEVASDLTRRSRENSLVEDSDRRSLVRLKLNNQDGSTTTFIEYDADETYDPNHHHHHHHHPPSRTPPTVNTISSTPKILTNNHIDYNSKNSIDSVFRPSPNEKIDPEEYTGNGNSDYSTDSEFQRTPPRPSTRQVARQLKQNSSVTNFNQLSDLENQQLQDTVEVLRGDIEILRDQKHSTTERLSKIQVENTQLKQRLLALEEGLHDLQSQHNKSVQSEQQRYNKQRSRFYT
ncbi:unnamed protein product [Didymodactylos carnosus]|uniref:EF-hand domain-containing protein n=1 Tax=Didymodactylos carnosus TaxID=1234261 RepID=A0A8S2E4L1_9BILA|nr:unnamed protein product [Didymodactylos carnosus]CAF3897978.1 unnamed protein product [Didymodactylos carnosus]